MQHDINKTLKTISSALDEAFKRALQQEQAEGEKVLDVNIARLVIFSDHHKGNRDGADDFRACEAAYNAALAYYYGLGYTLFVLGDVEELWEEWPQTVLKAYPHTLELEGKFHQDGRYMRFWGNHDDGWSHPDLVDQLLRPALGGGSIKVRESLILHIRDGEKELGRLFLIHGHQGTLDSDRIAPLSKFLLRYFWRPFQRITKFSFNTPAKDFELRYEHESAMYFWSQAQEKLVLIAGHTHRPVFKSESREQNLRKALNETTQKLITEAGNRKLQERAAELAADLEWTLVRNRQMALPLPLIEFKKPSYFNSGCCAFRDGDVTGIELIDGEIRLMRWPNDEGSPKPQLLGHTILKEVFDAC